MKPARRRALVLAAIALAGLAGAGAWYFDRVPGLGPHAPALPAGQRLEVAQLEELPALPAFTLRRAAGPYGLADLRGRWSFIFFGYTNCPNACPATLAVLAHVQESLRAHGVAPPRIVFVSLDPQRDTPAVLERYAQAFGNDTVGVTGEPAALQGLLTFFGVTFERKPLDAGSGADAAAYTLDHTTNFFLVRPDGRWLATFAPVDDGAAVLADTTTLLRLPPD